MTALERVWVCDTITGQRLNVIPMKDFPWARCLNEGSNGRAVIVVNDSTVKTLNLRNLIVERTNTLVYEVGGKVVAAGVIMDTDYDKDAGTLTISHADIWKILEGRLLIKHGAAAVKTEKLAYGPLSLGTIAKRVVQEAIAPGGWYDLQILFPADVAGTETRSYFGYALQSTTDVLQEIMESDGGPDIELAPQWNIGTGNLEYVMRAVPNLTSSGVWEYNLDAPKCAASKVTATSDTSRFANNAYATGEGTEKNILLRSNPQPDHTRPADEGVTPFKGVKDAGVLGSLAVERSRVLSVPTRQYTMSILKDGTPAVTDLALGDTVRLISAADPWLPVGTTAHRLIKFSGSLGSMEVKIEFQPTGA